MTDDKVGHLRRMYVEDAAFAFDHTVGLMSSPIEQLFLAAALTDGFDHFADMDGYADLASALEACGAQRTKPYTDWSVALAQRGNHKWGCLVAQVPVKLVSGRLIRVDFVLWWPGCAPMAIELDGHDFHERTKEQARSDKSRDRDLTAMGWAPVRFTGSEVYRDAHACLRQAMTIFQQVDRARRWP